MLKIIVLLFSIFVCSDPKFGTFDDTPIEDEKIIADLVDITHYFGYRHSNPEIIEARAAEFIDSDSQF